MTNDEKVEKAREFILDFGGIDGGHHKTWTLDQVLRILCGDHYDLTVALYKTGEDGPDTYEWDTGIAP